MDNENNSNKHNPLKHIELEMQFQSRYKDIFLARINDIEFCLEQEHYMAALSLALTLPDICGKAEYPSDGTTSRYIKWFNQFMTQYKKSTSPYSDDMPYLSGETVYNLRNEFLHSGNPGHARNSGLQYAEDGRTDGNLRRKLQVIRNRYCGPALYLYP